MHTFEINFYTYENHFLDSYRNKIVTNISNLYSTDFMLMLDISGQRMNICDMSYTYNM